MSDETIMACGHTTRDGTLNLSLNVGVPDVDVAITVRVKSLAPADELDANGWPKGFFDRVAGSMPELRRASQGQYEKRLALE